MPFTRRTVLAVAGAAVGSGCTSTRASSDRETPPPREVKDISIDVPTFSDLEIAATITRARITPAQTAQFDLTVTWTGDDPQPLTFGNAVPFSEPNHSHDANGVVLLTPESGVKRKTRQTWVPNTGNFGYLPSENNLVTGEFDPGESVMATWEVWGDPEYVSTIEPGTYTFENTIGRGGVAPASAAASPVPWTLTVVIEQATDGCWALAERQGFLINSGYHDTASVTVTVFKLDEERERRVFRQEFTVGFQEDITVRAPVFTEDATYRVVADGLGETVSETFDGGDEQWRLRRTVYVNLQEDGSLAIGSVHVDGNIPPACD